MCSELSHARYVETVDLDVSHIVQKLVKVYRAANVVSSTICPSEHPAAGTAAGSASVTFPMCVDDSFCECRRSLPIDCTS